MGVFIHERPDWPRFRWDAGALATLLAAVRHRQGRLLGRVQSLGFDLRTEANLVTLTSDVVKSSAIEGEILPPDEVRSSIARRLGLDTAGLPRAGRAVDGFVEVMLDATQRAGTPLTRERLFGWHAALFPTGRSGLRRITVGAWRPVEGGTMQVVSGPAGRERVHFEAPAGDRIDAEMGRFLDWIDAPGEVDPVIVAGIAHLWFVTIHPFEDGNGRIARAIADRMLALADGTHERFYSMSTRIEAERKGYYNALESAQRGDLDVTAWLEWFLECLGRAIEGADRTLAAVLHKAAIWDRIRERPVNARQQQVVNRMLDDFQGFLTTSKYAAIAKCSQDTALRDIRELLERGVLLRNPAGGRSVSYRLARLDEMPDGGR